MALRKYDKGDYGIWTSMNIYLTVNIWVTSHWYNVSKLAKFVSKGDEDWNKKATVMLVRVTNTRTKTRYAFETVKPEEVKVSATRQPTKTLETRIG